MFKYKGGTGGYVFSFLQIYKHHRNDFQPSSYCLPTLILLPCTSRTTAIYDSWKCFPYRYTRHLHHSDLAYLSPVQGISITQTWHSHHRHPRKNASLPVILMRLTNFKRRIKDVKRYFRIFAAKT